MRRGTKSSQLKTKIKRQYIGHFPTRDIKAFWIWYIINSSLVSKWQIKFRRIRQCFHPCLQQISSLSDWQNASARISWGHPLGPEPWFLLFQNTKWGKHLLDSACSQNPCISRQDQPHRQLSENTSGLRLDKIENRSLCCNYSISKKGFTVLHWFFDFAVF